MGAGNEILLTSNLSSISSLADPNADRILFWDDSAGGYAYLTPGTGLSISGTTLNGSASSPSQFDATVGASGADYTTISAALAASKTRLLAIDDVTETADCAVPAVGLYIYVLKGKTIDFATNSKKFTCAASRQVTIEGQERDACNIQYAFGSSDVLVDNILGRTVFKSITIYNTSTANITNPANTDGEQHYTDVRMLCPDKNFAGLSVYNAASTLTNVEVNGGGTSCDNALDIEAHASCVNILITGIFSTTGGLYIGNGASVSNIVFNNAGAMYCSITVGAMVSGLWQNNAAVTVQTGNDAKLINVSLMRTGGVLDIDAADRAQITNVQAVDLDMSDSASSNCLMTNVRVTNAVTFAGDRNKAVNCDFIGGSTVSSGADNNGFSNCQFGADAGGGALTLTIDSGSNRTRVSNCMSDAAISDSGTDSALSNNTVY